MSEDKFLARWSRRKQEASANATLPDRVGPDEVQPALPPAVKDPEVEFDLSSLPPLDSITGASDITAFLHKGVPRELTRAALRRAWSADPAIRDFVGLAENAWDFNDPTAMPGFGPLDCPEGELAALADRVLGGLRKSVEAMSETSVEQVESSQELHQTETSNVATVAEGAAAAQLISAPAAAQPMVTENAESQRGPIRRRTHGGALPR
jgi:hypothetical protein